MRIAIDTNTYTSFVSGDKKSLDVFQEAESLILPIPVVAELRYGFLNGSRKRENEEIFEMFCRSKRVTFVSCDSGTANYFALLKHQLKKQGTPIPINDIWIAALVLQHDLMLYSLDQDFLNIPQLARI